MIENLLCPSRRTEREKEASQRWAQVVQNKLKQDDAPVKGVREKFGGSLLMLGNFYDVKMGG